VSVDAICRCDFFLEKRYDAILITIAIPEKNSNSMVTTGPKLVQVSGEANQKSYYDHIHQIAD